MSNSTLKRLPTKPSLSLAKLLAFTTVFASCLAFSKSAQAATFALNEGTVANTFTECINDGIALKIQQNPVDQHGWQYAVDSPNDGVNGSQIGGNIYEIYTLALRETKDSIWVAINANMPLTGADGTSANDGNIGWGDLFFNFTGKDFSTASNEGSLFGVRFAGTNDSFVPQIGLYNNVSAASTTGINSGFSSLQEYNQYVATYGCQGEGCGPSLGDLPADTSYFDQTKSLNTIASGQFLTSIMYLSEAELQEAGYNFNQSGGSQTIAFKFDKSSICKSGYCKSVPEPSGAIGLVAIGLMVGANQLRKRYKN